MVLFANREGQPSGGAPAGRVLPRAPEWAAGTGWGGPPLRGGKLVPHAGGFPGPA